jgi:hypothetical protein
VRLLTRGISAGSKKTPFTAVLNDSSEMADMTDEYIPSSYRPLYIKCILERSSTGFKSSALWPRITVISLILAFRNVLSAVSITVE